MDSRWENPSVGTRISFYGNPGTIGFVGEVENTTDIWLGVEWDDPRRGKHDGVKNGKRYFTCRIPNAGSFIRPSASICYGKSFLHALTAKYIEHPHGTAVQEIVLLGSSKGAIEVEAVGLDKIRGKFANLHTLRLVSLDGENVASCDPPGDIRKVCPNVRSVDLSFNLLPSWDIVGLIATELEFLERLSLNHSRLQPFSHTHAECVFLKLTELQLNSTMMTWRELQDVAIFMPNLRLVEFGYNHLTTLSPLDPLATFESNIETINLDSNMCHDWHQICEALRSYQSLQRLILTSNHIDKIIPLQDDHLQLRCLKQLSLSFNLLSSWSDIDSLSRWCPGLENLSITGNPLVEDADKSYYSRQFIVARIPSLLVLNAVAISLSERADCELFYISHVVRNGPSSDDDRQREHPRWKDLCLKHGLPEETPKKMTLQDKLSNRIIQLDIFRVSSPSTLETCATQAGTHLGVLPTMLLGTFRLKVLKSVSSRKLSGKVSVDLWLKMEDGELVPLDTEYDNQDLAWWGIEDNSHVLYHINT